MSSQLQQRSVWSWGEGTYGKLGLGPDLVPEQDQPYPTVVSALQGQEVEQVACGKYHSLAVTRTGHVWVWGDNTNGQLGWQDPSGLLSYCDDDDPITYIYQPEPTLFSALQGQEVVQVACGMYYSLAVTRTGHVWAWGDAYCGCLGLEDFEGLPHLGDHPEYPYQPKPTLVSALQGQPIVQVACGELHSLAVGRGGHVWAWGCASLGRLG